MKFKVEQSKSSFKPVTVSFTIDDEKLLEAIKTFSDKGIHTGIFISCILHDTYSDEQELADNFIDKLFLAITKGTE